MPGFESFEQNYRIVQSEQMFDKQRQEKKGKEIRHPQVLVLEASVAGQSLRHQKGSKMGSSSPLTAHGEVQDRKSVV